ncbi:MAG: DEAD/DEAH box helicase family protein [Synechococcaceae cyanobacterium]|nr:DEAD/DEAH box helicase family protein [Synechococcaceae cyanobacterium]
MPSPSFLVVQSGAGRPQRPAVALRPRAWQSQLVQLLRARLETAGPSGQDVLVHAGPGAGKTLGALLAFDKLQRERRLDRFVVFCHRSSIAGQWRQAAARLGLVLGEWNDAGLEASQDGLLISYQSASRHRQRLLDLLQPADSATTASATDPLRVRRQTRWLAIADEVHHLGVDPEEPEAAAWGYAFTSLTGRAQLRLGLSGTPFRADNLAFCAARRLRSLEEGQPVERIVPDLCVEPRQLILAGDVRPLEFCFQDGWVEHGRATSARATDLETSPLSVEVRESWRARNLRRAIRLGDEGGIAMRLMLQARQRLERVRADHPEAGGLVIARDIEHARGLADLLREQGDKVHLVHSQDPEAAAQLTAFRDGHGDWLVSVDMCAEGFDAPRLRVVAYLTTVVTRSRFVQAITRAVRMDSERSRREPVPRQASYVYAPADPLLISHARSWSLSEPYVIRGRSPEAISGAGTGGLAPAGAPLQALADGAGSVLRLRGPELPDFLARGA